jgi:RNA 3'-terminal phosphate cyclase (GTP)
VTGAVAGSQELRFEPGPVRSGEWSLDVGTAGAVTLVAQSILVPALASGCRVRFHLVGGTDTSWSPSVDYLAAVTLPALAGFGSGELAVERRGYYPKGGGRAILELAGSARMPPPLVCERRPEVERIAGVSHASAQLRPRRVAERQAQAAEAALSGVGVPTEIEVEYGHTLCAGSGIVVWTAGSRPALAGSALGARGRRAEEVGAAAAAGLIRELESGAAVDRFLADQLVPFLALAGGRLRTSEITEHARSNVEVASAVLGAQLRVDEDGGVIEAAGPVRIGRRATS